MEKGTEKEGQSPLIRILLMFFNMLRPLFTGVWGIVTNVVLIACLTLDAHLTPRVASPATRPEPATT